LGYRNIPGTDLNVSDLCLGTGNMGKKIPTSTSEEILDLFLELGGNFIDTAKIYADWLPGEQSSSEKTICQWIRDRRIRKNVVLATKGGHPDLSTMFVPRLSPEEIRSDLTRSLSNLRVDTVDIYWLHRDDPGRPVDEILGVLDEQVRAGSIRFFGLSNWRANRLREAFACSTKYGYKGFIANQMHWSLAYVDVNSIDQTLAWMNEDMYEFHCQSGLAAIPYSSQANGLFQKLHAGKRPNESMCMYPENENKKILGKIMEVVKNSGLSISQVVLAYLLSQPFPVFPIIGPQNKQQLRDSFSALESRITPRQFPFLDRCIRDG
jgi:aryl-alcohol dehydrogenase-like predicted oxidoreductase